jgi:hypothetical protein
MSRGLCRPSPALIVACIALFVALGGTVYAATGRIDGKAIKLKSLPGNRLLPNSVSGDRLKAGTISGSRLERGSVTGSQVDAATLGQVPSAVHADTADSARDAATALHAVDAITASKVNGHSAGCGMGSRPFAGACWQTASSEAAVTAPAAAESCASQGGELPDALSLAAFSKQPGIHLDPDDEWTGDVPTIAGLDVYGVITVSSSGHVDFVASTAARSYRCVIPLVS